MNRILNVLKDYAGNLANFQRNAWLYLIHTILSGAAMGVFRLLFNFYGTSLGYDSQLIGGLITASSFTALIVALPMGLLADKLGRKVSLLTSSLTVASAVMLMALFPSPGLFIGMNILMGMAQSLGGITMGPFLIENSSDRERVYLFSFASGMNMISGFA
ncbi:MAG TPA: MFS transporter, partial [Anaerolineaceae bacterium]|nr:MFS transporter [Anaerolineaceae bacterium]HOG78374.1 MFS transporter [Anaerolineaceae bacterium]